MSTFVRHLNFTNFLLRHSSVTFVIMAFFMCSMLTESVNIFYYIEKGAMKFIDLSGDSEFESRLEWAKYLRILSKHYADAFNMMLLNY